MDEEEERRKEGRMDLTDQGKGANVECIIKTHAS